MRSPGGGLCSPPSGSGHLNVGGMAWAEVWVATCKLGPWRVLSTLCSNLVFPQDARRQSSSQVGKRGFRDAVSTRGHPQTRSQPGCRPRTHKARRAPSHTTSPPPINPAIPDHYQGRSPGPLIQKHAEQREWPASRTERPGALCLHTCLSLVATRSHWSETHGHAIAAPFSARCTTGPGARGVSITQ